MIKAQVKLSTGRMYLDVNGVAVAMEGDPCREIKFPGNRWDEASLNEAARIINSSLDIHAPNTHN